MNRATLFATALRAAFLVSLVVASPGIGAGQGSPDEAEPPEPTLIASDTLELVSEAAENRFIFEGNVTIRATRFYGSCDRLEVVTSRTAAAGDSIGEFGSILRILASGDVRIQQGDREATCGRAMIFPPEGKVVLEETPVVRDPRGVLTGYRMVLEEGSSTIRIEAGPDGERTRAILPDIRDLNLDKPRPNRDAKEAAPTP